MIEMQGKTVLVTGGSRGIGAAATRALVGVGARVVIHYGRNRAAAETLAELGGLEGEVNDLCADLRNAAVAEAGEAADQREAQLAELGALAALLQGARSEAADADLRAQLGR